MQPSDAGGIRVLATVTCNPNQLRAHLLPILSLPEVDRVTLVADRLPPDIPKLRAVVPPRWLVRTVGRAAAKLVVCSAIALRERPDWVIGFNFVPHGFNAMVAARLARPSLAVAERRTKGVQVGEQVDTVGRGRRADSGDQVLAELARLGPGGGGRVSTDPTDGAGGMRGGLRSPPYHKIAMKRLGFRELVDLSRTMKYQANALVTLRRFAQTQPSTITAFMQSYVEAVRVFKQDREFTLGVLSRAMRITDKEILDDTYGFYRDYFEDIPHPTLEGVQLILDEMAPNFPRAREARPQDFVDLRFVQALDAARGKKNQ